ncbi:MAG: protein-export chaperone SecB, partial [Gammaproteobacteria bacterium]|nr:protein-export chaperone SecB [Gammaproteobacteria bacterium]
MSEENSTNDREFGIQKIYLKDVSFEAPATPGVFQKEWKPDVNLQLGNSAVTLGENVHEIVLTVTVTVKIENDTAYLVEVKQAGIFNIKGYNDQEMGMMAGS